MGGKRTKNNTKPSSSGRSAELLGTSVPTLFGFSALDSTSMPVVPGFVQIDAGAGDETMDPNLDDTLQIVLRKMLKKDPVTKTKALLEFTELINSAELEVVKAVLPFWPRLFVNLSTDAEHRVRETAQQAQAAIVARAGKNIAPFLRQLAPAWISSQYDTYAPAASVASQSFNSAFPPGKVNEVFVYCENEILDYYTKNLTVHTAITLSNPKSHTPEECENKYQRVLISSLRGYALYLGKIPAENLKKSAEKNTKLLESPKFWTYHKHKTAAIRSAWFEVISALLQHAVFLVEQHQAQVTTSVFQFLDESDPTVVSHVWSSIVMIQANLPGWHTHLNFDKAVFPKLWKLLKSGGDGNAACVYPHMLPLVSGFTREVLGADRLAKFYGLFFESMNEGLKVVQSSRADVSAVSQAYYEAFQYVVLQVQRDEAMAENERTEFCLNLLEHHLIGVIAWCITSEAACGKYVFQNMANLLDHWCQHSGTHKLYERLLVTFWERLYGVVKESVNNKENASTITDSHVDLVQNLKRTSHKRVKFAAPVVESHDAVDGAGSCPLTTGDHASRFENQLQLLVYRICQLYIAKISVERDEGYILQLEFLIRAFQCHELFVFLADGSENIKTLFETFARWLQDGKLQSEYIVELIMILYKYLDASERIALLNKWIKMANKTVQSWIIMRALSHPLCQEPNIKQFLSQPEVTNNIVNCAHSVATGDTKDNMILLQKCFFVTSSGEILIDEQTCRKILDTVAAPLGDPSKEELHDGCISFLAQIMPVICSDARLTELHRMLFCTLFEFTVQNVVSDHLSDDTLWEATTAWQDALGGEDIELDGPLIERCVSEMDKRLRELATTGGDGANTLELVEKLAEVTAKLLACSTEANKRNEQERCKQLIGMWKELSAKSATEEMAQAEATAQLAEYIELLLGKLTTNRTKSPTLTMTNEEFSSKMKSSLVRAVHTLSVVVKLSCKVKAKPVLAVKDKMEQDKSNDCEEMDVCDDDDEDASDEMLILRSWSEFVYEKVLSVIYLATVGETILYNTEQLEPMVECLIIAVQEKLSLLLTNAPPGVLGEIKRRLFALSNEHGMLWAKSLGTLLVVDQYAEKDSGPVLLYEDASTTASNNSEDLMAYINILQSLAAKMDQKCLPIGPNLFENYFDILVKLCSARCLIENHFSSNYNELNDRKIIGNCLIVLHELISRQTTNKMLLYNCDLNNADENKIFLDAEVANVLTIVLRYFPSELDISKWDFIRIALSSWTLTVSKSFNNFRSHNISLFIASIFRLFNGLTLYFGEERKRSSSELLSNVIEEWDNVFAKDVNLVLLRAYVGIVNEIDCKRKIDQYFIDTISPYVESVDLSFVLKANKIDGKTSLDDLLAFALVNIQHWNKRVRFAATTILRSLAIGLIQRDLDQLQKRNESSEQHQKSGEEPEDSWHLLQRFKPELDQFENVLGEFVADFSYKATEVDGAVVKTVDDDRLQEARSRCMSFLLLWDCILGICAKAPSELRSIYASWISRNKFEQLLLPVLFKLMPQEILRNPDSCAVYGQTMFSSLEWNQIKNPNVKLDRYACHLYTQTLRHLPVIVRRWFNGLNHRHSTIVSKITANCVSGLLCQEEFQALVERKDRQDNMQIKVHSAMRQVTAVYSIDEAKMELHITLPNNFPLGAVTVEGGKQIGGRLQSRQVVMQLSIFLTHQNGSIGDGLSLWKRNLDRKFEGVEECYVCYSVIHQDTCQLPKLSCKTCKKKFHGPCLYRWFSTSNKSTCPICRNIF
ncbi:E3 ubiquitin-protein ligase listerin [Anopheles ziemanni]|uniref:E3 ubiquitin-protein ligase listerin n=1 Tax=Anopheles coustani TaxID=139045 RepID=UPI00265A02E6|nr:E3 ubiquitin-protein ligase listerin [Anopheles coustani]XP_058168060.1 E3 ubiquitin-protein ligase listerin [Anopheles ziemanni]